MILTPDPIPVSALLSVERIDRSEDRDDVYEELPDGNAWLEDWWEQVYPEERL